MNSASSEGAPVRTRASDAVWLFALALLLYLWNAQRTLYYTDGHFLLQDLHHGSMSWPTHVLTRPILYAWGQLSGLPPYLATTSASAVSAALAVSITYAVGGRLGLSRRQSIVAATLVAGSAPMFFFATVVEYHGVLQGITALVWYFAARLGPSKSLGIATALGATAGLATLVHGSAMPLGAAALLWSICITCGGLRDWLRPVSVALGSQAICLVIGMTYFHTRDWLRHDAWDLDSLTAFSVKFFERLPEVWNGFWREWVVAFFPLSLTLTLWLPGRRLECLALLVGVGGYCLLTASAGLAVTEYGAYFIPLTLPAAILLVRCTPLWACVTVAAVGLGRGYAHIHEHDEPRARIEAFLGGLHELAEPQRPHLVGLSQPVLSIVYDRIEVGVDEHAICMVSDEPLPFTDLRPSAGLEPSEITAFLSRLGELLRMRAGDSPLLISEDSLIRLQDLESYPAGEVLLTALRNQFELVPAVAQGFRGFRLRRLQ